ncbi:hypothetical protein EYF80_017823 [Liparis tanakae]|uniref:Uncharacterized protein n=1 Tax=Liparis tanakae TaxID=230148 RepID=A0A4Z2I3I7_9TELE|nr:hypothetical protein EYF80_017823 [Liparis tanakae]
MSVLKPGVTLRGMGREKWLEAVWRQDSMCRPCPCQREQSGDSRAQRLEVVTISMSNARSKGRASLRLASSSSRNGLEGETSSSGGKGGSGMPTG